jgi:hypothetical protein
MPVVFEEVIGDIQGEPAPGPSAELNTPRDKPAEDLAEQIERSLRLLDERRARLCAD